MEDDEVFTTRYDAAVTNLRDTTKWILSASAGIGALIAGGSSLSALGALGWGPRLWLALGSSLLAVLAVGAVIFLAAKVLTSTEALQFAALCRAPKYRKHRTRIETDLACYFPPQAPHLPSIARGYMQARKDAPGSPVAAKRLAAYAQWVDVVLAYARWLEVTFRYDRAIRAFIAALFLIVLCLYAFAWAANPPKSIGRDLDKPIFETLPASPPNTAMLAASGMQASCLQPPLRILVYRQEPPDLVDAFTIPGPSCPSLRILYRARTATILSVH